MENNQPLPPSTSYSEIIADIGRSLKDRQKDLFKRILLISWPVIVLSVAVYLYSISSWKLSELPQGINPVMWILLGVAIIALVFLYYSVVSFVFAIEKHLWIRSFFRNQQLNSKESWRIAWGLFGAIVELGIRVFLRYYLFLLIVIPFAIILFYQFAPAVGMDASSYAKEYMIFYGILVVGTLAYLAVIALKLRFAFFLFLDKRDTDSPFTYSTFFRDMNALNKIAGSDSIKKVLVADIGAGTVRSITTFAIRQFSGGIQSLGSAAGVFGAALRPFGEESVRQFTSFARLTAVYVLYDKAKLSLDNSAQ